VIYAGGPRAKIIRNRQLGVNYADHLMTIFREIGEVHQIVTRSMTMADSIMAQARYGEIVGNKMSMGERHGAVLGVVQFKAWRMPS